MTADRRLLDEADIVRRLRAGESQRAALTLQVPRALFEQIVLEAKRDELTVAEWLLEAAALRLQSRRPAWERAAKRDQCRWCNRVRPIQARGYCKNCYQTQYRAAYIGVCTECGRRRVMRAQGLCNACYQRQYRRRRRSRPASEAS